MGEGWTVDTPTAFRLDLDLENRLFEEEERIREARLARDRAVRRAAEARSEHEEALRAAKECVAVLDLGDDELVPTVIGVRLQTVDRLLAIGTANPPDSYGQNELVERFGVRTVFWAMPAMLAVSLAVAIYVIGKVKGKAVQQEPTASEMISKFRESHSRGELSDEELEDAIDEIQDGLDELKRYHRDRRRYY